MSEVPLIMEDLMKRWCCCTWTHQSLLWTKEENLFFSTELRIICQVHQHTSVCYNSRVEMAFSLSTVWLISDYKQLYPQGPYCFTSLQTQKCVGTRDLHRNCTALLLTFLSTGNIFQQRWIHNRNFKVQWIHLIQDEHEFTEQWTLLHDRSL